MVVQGKFNLTKAKVVKTFEKGFQYHKYKHTVNLWTD